MSAGSVEPQEPGPAVWGRFVPLHPNSTHISIDKNPFVFGRNPERCEHKFENPKISAVHCAISKADGCILLEDLSTNGTFLKGQRIGKGKKHVVEHGDVISFLTRHSSGPLSFMFQALCWEDKCEDKDEIHKHYMLTRTLGTGNFSAVKLCIDKKSGIHYAVKIIDKQKFWHLKKTREQILSEVEILHQIQHANIISVVRVFDEARYFYIVLELANGGELFDQIRERGSISEPDAKNIFEQVLKGVKYLHDLNISHRDLKPENILIDVQKGVATIKITDFGLARIIGENQTAATLCGTPMYVAPEVLAHGMHIQGDENAGSAHGYGKEVDAWSLGCILYVLLSGRPPFDDRINLFEQIRSGQFEFDGEVWDNISDDAKDLVRKLLVVRPDERLTIQEALSHPWICERAPERRRSALKPAAGSPTKQPKKVPVSPSSSAKSRGKEKIASENDDLNTTEVMNTPAPTRKSKVGLMEPSSSPFKAHDTNKRKSVDPSVRDEAKEDRSRSPQNRPNKRRNTTNVVSSLTTPTPSAKRTRFAPKSLGRGKSEPEILVSSTPANTTRQLKDEDEEDPNFVEEKIESTQTRKMKKRAGRR